MSESKQGRVASKKSTEQLKAERQSDATDDEVLRQEESRSSSQTAEQDQDRTPSPDGAFDERKNADNTGPI